MSEREWFIETNIGIDLIRTLPKAFSKTWSDKGTLVINTGMEELVTAMRSDCSPALDHLEA